MAIPVFQAAGTPALGIGTASPAWPTHVTDDIALLLVESANEAVTLTTPAGFVECPGSPQGTGTAGAVSATRLTVFWCRATSAAMAAPLVADPGDHVNAQIVTFRGCTTTGNPWNTFAGGVDATSDTSLNAVGPITTAAECLAVFISTVDTDIGTARWTGEANANLGTLTEQVDQCAVQGNGGGIAVWTGTRAVAGDTGTLTATAATATVKGWVVLALMPPTPAAAVDAPTSTPFASRRRYLRGLAPGRVLRAVSGDVDAAAAGAPPDDPLQDTAFAARRRDQRFGRPPRLARAVSRDGVDQARAFDDFNRANGSPVDVAHPWLLIGGAGAIAANQLSLPSAGDLLWDAVFPVDQEASVVLANANWPSQALLYLKVQGPTTASTSHIGVIYDNAASQIQVETWDSGALFVTRGTFSGVVLQAGDTMAARVTEAGLVSIYRNGGLIGTVSVAAWPDFAKTGRVGLGWWGTNVTTFRADDFGGGPGSIQSIEGTYGLVNATRRRDLRGRVPAILRAQSSDDFAAPAAPSVDEALQDISHAARRRDLRGLGPTRARALSSSDEATLPDDTPQDVSHAARRRDLRGLQPGRVLRAQSSDDATAAAAPAPDDPLQDVSHAARRRELRGQTGRVLRAQTSEDATAPSVPPADDPLQDVSHAARRKDLRGLASRIQRAQSSDGDTPPLDDALQDAPYAARRRDLRGLQPSRLQRSLSSDGDTVSTPPPTDDPLQDVSHAARRRDLRGLQPGRLQRASSADGDTVSVPPPPVDEALQDVSHAARRRDLRSLQPGRIQRATSSEPGTQAGPALADPIQDWNLAARRRDLRGVRARATRVWSGQFDVDGLPSPFVVVMLPFAAGGSLAYPYGSSVLALTIAGGGLGQASGKSVVEPEAQGGGLAGA